MDIDSEFEKSKAMIEGAGFKILDIQFEGVLEASNEKVIEVIQKMAKDEQAFGVLRLFYGVDKDVRVIEIPVGQGAPPPQQ